MYPREKLRQALTLYAVTDTAWLENRTLTDCVEQAVANGATSIQLRAKNESSAALVLRSRTLMPICRAAGVPYVINDDIQAARIVGADGIHIGQNDASIAEARDALGPDAIVGVSVHTVEQAKEAQEAGADYLGVGAMFSTSTKEDAQMVGVNTLAEICKAVDIPVVAIGGLNKETIPQLKDSGVDGVAVVSAIFAADDIANATTDVRAVIKETLVL